MAHSEQFVTRAPPVEGGPVELNVLSFLDSFGEENSTAERCYRSHSRSSVLQGLPFGGVPTVLLINVVLWMVQTHSVHPLSAASGWTILGSPLCIFTLDALSDASLPFLFGLRTRMKAELVRAWLDPILQPSASQPSSRPLGSYHSL